MVGELENDWVDNCQDHGASGKCKKYALSVFDTGMENYSCISFEDEKADGSY